MSDRSHSMPAPEGERFESSRFAGLSVLIGLIALVALTLCVVGAIVDPLQFSFSWLFAFAFFFTLCAGCFFWTIVHHATDAEWSVGVRRQLENIGSLLAMMAYGPNIIVADRWAIIAYLRALQRSQNATAADVPPERRADLEKP